MIFGIVIGIVLALVVGVYFIWSTEPTVTSQGMALFSVQPDLVSLYLSVEGRGANAQSAQANYTEKAEQVFAALEQAGIQEKAIQTVNYNIYEEYDWVNGDRKSKEYIASQQLIIKTADFKSVAHLVDVSVQAGALVSTINFELSQEKQNEYKVQALAAAGKDAQRKADAVASGLGKKLGALVSVSSSDFNYPGPVVYYAKAEAGRGDVREAAVRITPQELEVSASVQVQYRLR